MRTVNTWLRVLFKKTIYNKAFIGLLLLIPILCYCLGAFSNLSNKDADATIYIYARSEDEISTRVIDSLEGEYDGFSFVYADSEKQIKDDVRTHKALCGYILEKDQDKRIRRGEQEGNIILVERIGNLQTDIVNEIVFSAYYREYTRYYAPLHVEMANKEDFNKNYDEITDNTLLNYTIEKVYPEDDSNDATGRSARNIIGVILCLFAMLLISDFIQEKDSGLLFPVKPSSRLLFRCLYFATPIFMIAPSALLGTMIQSNNRGFLAELIQLILYSIMLIVLCVICSYLIKKRHVIIGMIPILTILFIVLCPVFIDLSTFLPIINILRYFCPPFYFMI